MSSGEADAYTITVDHTTVGDTFRFNPTPTITTGNTYTGTSTYWIPSTVYMYQIRCPRCKKMNWAQLDTTITCSNTSYPKNSRAMCGARLKAVSEVVDYEVPVEA